MSHETRAIGGAPMRRRLPKMGLAIAYLIVFSFFVSLLMLVAPIYLMQVFDRVLAGGRIETLLFLTMIALFAIAVLGLLEALRNMTSVRFGRWVERRLFDDVAGAVVGKAVRGRGSSAQPLRDLATVRNAIASPILSSTFDVLWTPFFVALIWMLHPVLGVVALLAALALVALGVANELWTRRNLALSARHSIQTTGSIDAAVRNADAIVSMGMLPGLAERWIAMNGAVQEQTSNAGDKNAAIVGLTRFLRLGVQILVLAIGAYYVLESELTPGGMIAGSILLGRALAPFEQIVGRWKQIIAAKLAWSRLSDVFASLPEPPQRMLLAEPAGHLICNRLNYVSFQSGEPILQNVSLEVAPGTALGIVGPSGAGKSTLCKIIVGAWQAAAGKVRLDGVEISQWDPDQLGRQVGYLPQEVQLFDGPVAQNIARFRGDVGPAEITEAADAAAVHEMVLSLPQGYASEIGEWGCLLSGGQRQRIALARAFLGKPRLIVLDEPSSNLDSDGEEALSMAIRRAKAWGAAVVIVSHSRQTLQEADDVVFLRGGKVLSFGPRDEVLNNIAPMRRVGGMTVVGGGRASE